MTIEQSAFLLALQSIDRQLADWAQQRFDEGYSLDQIKGRIRRAMIASGRE